MENSDFSPIIIIIYLGIILLVVASMWKIFTKAGKPGWAAIIPIYNTIVLLEIVKKPVWWIILFFIPFVNIVIAIMVAHQLSLSFGKGVGFTIGLVLLGIVFYPILAFGDARYLWGEGAVEAVDENAPLDWSEDKSDNS